MATEPADRLAGNVDEIQELMWRLPTDFGGYATLELWGPVAVGAAADPLAIARRVYTSGRVVAVTGAKAAAWHKAVHRHIRAHTVESARDAADDLAARLIDTVTESLGRPRLAATVEYKPSQWYAALWEDWLLVTDTHAVVLHLGWDS